ncbi:hypothetical protein EK904_005739 [Melospiza melodia maxima]|nr:hypothetical protein EK904_005739 [Melospiza melodia maxima]
MPLSRGRPRRWQRPLLLLSALLWAPALVAFNLDEEKLTVYSGPPGSYFGYSVDFYIPDPSTVSVLVGAPKANTSQPDIVEGGAVYYCAWPGARCRQIPFDNTSECAAVPRGSARDPSAPPPSLCLGFDPSVCPRIETPLLGA